MSAIAALKGYRTQFLYSLHFILSNKEKRYKFRLEGEEDLDVLDEKNNLLFAVQVKNLSRTVTLSDVLSNKGTSFLKRFIENYNTAIPHLVSYGAISNDLLNWKVDHKTVTLEERAMISKYDLTVENWKLIKLKTVFEKIDENTLTNQILEMLKIYKSIDPVPTAENLLYWLQYSAEKQITISADDLFKAIERMATYLSERISFAHQFGKNIKALHLSEHEGIDKNKLSEEFYYGINARYEHIFFGLDIIRSEFLHQIDENFKKKNLVIIRGASGQGKSTLAYRYAADYAPNSLIYEVNLKENEVEIADAISAITAITKGLSLPVFFILNVAPNTTNWLKVVKEFTNHAFVRMMVTVRNEDWYRAQAAEIDFLYTDVELELRSEEAEVIFKRLENRKMIKHYADFTEAWIDLDENVPLLEFTYKITHGDSLTNRLKKQIDQLKKEDSIQKTNQLYFLKILSLADAFGAKIAMETIRQIPDVKFIVDKFEKEYLLKHIENGKYITGLHPVRSHILLDLLFDDFSSLRSDYILPCLNSMPNEDAYAFLLQCFHNRVIRFDELMPLIATAETHISWTFYVSIAKSLLWVGIRDYVDDNKVILDEVHQKTGAAWYIVADIYHGSTLDPEEFIKSLSIENNELLDFAKNVKSRLLPKQRVYQPVISLFNTVSLPQLTPRSIGDWNAFGEIIFWLSQTENEANKIKAFLREDFCWAFENLPIEDLASLMLGMHYYSAELDQIRLDFAHIFIERIRKKYRVPLLQISEDIQADFVIDIFDEDKDINVHDRSIEIIELLRTAFPEKRKFNSQGHGHRIKLLNSAHDDSFKSISVQNLPLDKWVAVNAILRRLYDFSHRPEDWVDFHTQLGAWEKIIKVQVNTFNNAFKDLRQSSTFKPIVPVLAQSIINHTPTLTTPKSIVDPLGLYIKTSKKTITEVGIDKSAKKEVVLSERYQPFFKHYSDYKNALENFTKQSGQALGDLLKNRSDSTHTIDENNLRISYVNLSNAITSRPLYYKTKSQHFSKFLDANNALTDLDLFTSATIWKTFWPAVEKGQTSKIITKQRIDSLKVDFEVAINKSFKTIQRIHKQSASYINDERTSYTPLILISASNVAEKLVALQLCYDAIHTCINGADYSSLKFLMLERYFPQFRFIGLINGFVIDYQWYDFSLHLLREYSFVELPFYALVTQPIDNSIVTGLNIKSWLQIYPKLKEVTDLSSNFSKLNLLVGHLADLKFFDNNSDLDEMGLVILKDHFNKIGGTLTDVFNVLSNELLVFAEKFPFNTENLNNDEHEYWTVLLDVMNNITPPGDNDSIAGESITRFDLPTLESWSSSLATALPSWGVLIMYLQNNYLTARNN